MSTVEFETNERSPRKGLCQQGREDSNLHHTGLETVTLAVELRPHEKTARREGKLPGRSTSCDRLGQRDARLGTPDLVPRRSHGIGVISLGTGIPEGAALAVHLFLLFPAGRGDCRKNGPGASRPSTEYFLRVRDVGSTGRPIEDRMTSMSLPRGVDPAASRAPATRLGRRLGGRTEPRRAPMKPRELAKADCRAPRAPASRGGTLPISARASTLPRSQIRGDIGILFPDHGRAPLGRGTVATCTARARL